jgi:hypothetical protein
MEEQERVETTTTSSSSSTTDGCSCYCPRFCRTTLGVLVDAQLERSGAERGVAAVLPACQREHPRRIAGVFFSSWKHIVPQAQAGDECCELLLDPPLVCTGRRHGWQRRRCGCYRYS